MILKFTCSKKHTSMWFPTFLAFLAVSTSGSPRINALSRLGKAEPSVWHSLDPGPLRPSPTSLRAARLGLEDGVTKKSGTSGFGVRNDSILGVVLECGLVFGVVYSILWFGPKNT